MIRERPFDKQNEREAGLKLEKLWNCDVFENNKFYRCDWQLMRNGKHLAFAEYKNCPRSIKEKGDHYTIDLAKYMYGLDLINVSCGPWFLIVEFTEGLFYFREDHPAHPIYEISRFVKKDQDGKYSKKPSVRFPIKEFEKISENKTPPI